MTAVGIDLGTTNTVVACVQKGRASVLSDEENRRLIPSVVSFHPRGEILVGYPAKERRLVDARNTVGSVKRLLGRTFDSPEISKARQRFPFELKEGPGNVAVVATRGKEYTLPEISAFVLKKACQVATQTLGQPVERAVITVPASFNELQRASTKVAAKVAGVEVLRIINEPTAAALAYGLGRTGRERICVYDFGGGTFDCTLLDLSSSLFEVLATAGESFLGGDDIDAAIVDRMTEGLLKQHRYDPKADPEAYERLRAAAEKLKIDLSTNENAVVEVSELGYATGGTPIHFRFELSRSELESWIEPIVSRTLEVCKDALLTSRLESAAFDKILVVGGSTRIPYVRRRVEEFFKRPLLYRVNPEEVVALGAAIQSAALSAERRSRSIPPPPDPKRTLAGVGGNPPQSEEGELPTVRTDMSGVLEMREARGASIADLAEAYATTATTRPGDESIPTLPGDQTAENIAARFSSTNEDSVTLPRQDLQLPIVKPAAIDRTVKMPVLVDVTPRALVVETAGGFCDTIVPRNAKIPCERTRPFSTAADQQTLVRIRVAQGEHPQFRMNTYLGEVELSGLRKSIRGDVTVAVRFEVDADGTLRVNAADIATGREAQATLQLVGIAQNDVVAAMAHRHRNEPTN